MTVDFVILCTGYDPREPIILGRPFLHTVKASIYVASANMRFDINGKKRRFTFNPPYPRRHPPRSSWAGVSNVDCLEIFRMNFYREPVIKGWQDVSWPVKKGDPSRPIIIVSIGGHPLQAVCDLGLAVNIIPLSICNNELQLAPLLKTNMRVRFADRSTCRIEGIIDDVEVLVGDSHVAADFAILDTDPNVEIPIILGRPFLHTARASIYTGTSNIHFDIGGKIESSPSKLIDLSARHEDGAPRRIKRRLQVRGLRSARGLKNITDPSYHLS